MRFWKRTTIIGLAGVASVLAVPRPCSAIEPEDGWAPWSYSVDATSTFIVPANVTAKTWSNVESIFSSSDVDYLLATCATGFVGGVQIDYVSSAGDLDLLVYNGTGTQLGYSGGVSGYEYVSLGDVYAQLAVVMKVYGYLGATGSYIVTVHCPT